MGAIKRLNNYDKGVVSTLYICFKTHGAQHDKLWEQYFEAGLLNREISKIAQEGARNHGLLNVSVTEFFRDITVHAPSEKEQIRIADFLGALDKKLELVSQQIEQTQTFKKGLLQQMFA
jgi:type I restriction enzyme S subunit